MGALKWINVVEQHQAWRIASCMWSHARVVHIVSNMMSLIFVGIQLEQEFRFVKIGLLYILSGIGESLLSCLFIRYTVSVGASGALFGLLGGMLSELLTNWTKHANKLTTLMTLVLIIAMNLAVGILSYVDNYAHLGGFVTGFFFSWVQCFGPPKYGWIKRKSAPPGYFVPALPKSKYKSYQYVLFALSLILLIAGLSIRMTPKCT